jgi:hypothetical protein
MHTPQGVHHVVYALWRIDGSVGNQELVSDALFAYNALDYNVTGNAMILLGADMHLDTVELDLSQWANTGTTVTEGDHTYAVYNASSAVAAQLLIDQHMVLANHA